MRLRTRSRNSAHPPGSTSLRWYRLASIVFVIGWEILRHINPLFLAPPSAILIAAYELTINGELPAAFAQSVITLLVGFVTASIIGILLGLLIGRYKPVGASTDWIVNALYATPLVAIIPLVIIWFGLGFAAKLFIVFKITVFTVLINTAAGVRNVPDPLIKLGNAFGATERQIFTKIILPSALPYMTTGLRLGIGRALIGMVVAEFYTAITGLGAPDRQVRQPVRSRQDVRAGPGPHADGDLPECRCPKAREAVAPGKKAVAGN